MGLHDEQSEQRWSDETKSKSGEGGQQASPRVLKSMERVFFLFSEGGCSITHSRSCAVNKSSGTEGGRSTGECDSKQTFDHGDRNQRLSGRRTLRGEFLELGGLNHAAPRV